MQIEILDFSPDIISGLLREAGERPVKLQLLVDGLAVAGNWGIPAQDRDAQTFRFNLKTIWSYIGDQARLQVRANDVLADLPAPLFAQAPKLSLEDLRQKLETGYVFNEKGRLQLSKTVDVVWQNNMFALFDGMSAILAEKGIKLFVMYGTLLGAYRNRHFIGHDHDFDAGYISGHTDPELVTAEFVDVAEALSQHGYHVVCKLSCLWVTDPKSKVTIDIFHTYFDGSEKLQLPFGVCGVKPFMRKDFHGYAEIELAGRSVLAVTNTEALVEYIYGPHWKTPNPGHNWNLDRTEKDVHGLAKFHHRNQIHWTDYYYRNPDILPPSSFAKFVSRSGYLRKSVVDVGCGNGRDSFYFKTIRPTVVGIDNCRIAVTLANNRIKPRPGGILQFLRGLFRKVPPLSFAKGNIADADMLANTLRKIRSSHRKGGVTLYARFLLHAVTRIQQDKFFETVSRELQSGDSIAFEFRTDQDELLKKANNVFGRRFIKPESVENQLADLGFKVVKRQEGTNLSKYRGENPHLCRLLFVKE